MASRARLRKNHQDDVRAKIQASVLVERMQRFGLKGELYDGRAYTTTWDPEKARVRMKVCADLLKKVLPDLTATTDDKGKIMPAVFTIQIDGAADGE